jgi:hypothetical protein
VIEQAAIDPGPVGPGAIVPRLQGAVGRVLPAIEAIVTRLATAPMPPREMERAARALAALTRTLRELNALLGQRQAREDDDDRPPRDVDALRRELARRLEAFIDKKEPAEPQGDGP